MTDHVLSPLDQAHAHRLDGDEEAALRLALACARASREAPGPVALVARVLIDQDRTLLGAEIAARLVDAFIRRGDLPGALVASTLALDAGEDQAPLIAQIAKAFAKGSPRIGDNTQRPPPFPKIDVQPDLNKLSGDALYAEADEVMQGYLKLEDPVPADSPLPALPLFAALPPKELGRLLNAIRVEEISGGQAVVRQDDQGQEAFVVARGVLKVVRSTGGDETLLAQLGPGAMFGEMALLSAAPRSASVVALEPTQLLVLGRAELERAAEGAPELSKELSLFCRGRMQANLMRHARVLSGLPMSQRAELLGKLEMRFFEPNEALIVREQEAESIYLIASGAVAVSVPEGQDRLVLATLGAGDVVGEISLILRRDATADVLAMYPTVAYELTRESLKTLMRTYPGLLVELYELATRRDDEIRAVSAEESLAADAEILV
ncbi:MAG: cyclic nucleotide-binding domain-containing protein [Myxococcales bacterium]